MVPASRCRNALAGSPSSLSWSECLVPSLARKRATVAAVVDLLVVGGAVVLEVSILDSSISHDA